MDFFLFGFWSRHRLALILLLPLTVLAAAPDYVADQSMVRLPGGVSAQQIQAALDSLPATGGEVVLSPGKIEVDQPIILARDNQALSGAGDTTVLVLADNANCPVIIMGEPVNHPGRTRRLRVSDLSIDGNRAHQQRELWKLSGEGSEIRNNGITVQGIADSVIENVTCAHCRSGGIVTTLGIEGLIVTDFTSYDNEFDGLACYSTEGSVFANLDLHDNRGAGISLDWNFNRNVIKNARLTGNDLGIFMRWSHGNQFQRVTVHDNRRLGVFIAQNRDECVHEPDLAQSGCVNNTFTDLVDDCARGLAFRINDEDCTNNVLVHATIKGDSKRELSMVQPNLVIMR